MSDLNMLRINALYQELYLPAPFTTVDHYTETEKKNLIETHLETLRSIWRLYTLQQEFLKNQMDFDLESLKSDLKERHLK